MCTAAALYISRREKETKVRGKEEEKARVLTLERKREEEELRGLFEIDDRETTRRYLRKIQNKRVGEYLILQFLCKYISVLKSAKD